MQCCAPHSAAYFQQVVAADKRRQMSGGDAESTATTLKLNHAQTFALKLN